MTVWSDTFSRANQSGWNTASDGETWSTTLGSPTLAISSNEGTLTGTSSKATMYLGSNTGINVDIRVRMKTSAAGGENMGIVLRGNSGLTTGYIINWSPTNTFNIGRTVSGAGANIANTTFTFANNTFYWIRARMNGSLLLAKTWQDGTTEPDWMLSSTDTNIQVAGNVGIRVYPGSTGDVMTFDSFLAYTLDQISIGNHRSAARIHSAIIR